MNELTAETPQTLHYDALDRIQQIHIGPATDLQRFYRRSLLVSQIMSGTRIGYLREASSLLAMVKNSTVHITGTDQQGSVVLTNETTPPPTLSYTAHGFNPAPDLLGYGGEATDPVTGCYLLGNGYRAYDPVALRFRSPDNLSPFGAGGINPYAYCRADPINRSDPTGHFDWIRWTGIAVTLFSAGLGFYLSGASLPGFAALTAKMTGGALGAARAATATNASIAAAVSVSLSASSTATGIASTVMFAFADGDETETLNARILGLVSGILAAGAAVASVAEARLTPKDTELELSNFHRLAPDQHSAPGYNLARPVSYNSLPEPPASPYVVPASQAATSPALSVNSRRAVQALARRPSTPNLPERAIELRHRGPSNWGSRDWADLYDRVTRGDA